MCGVAGLYYRDGRAASSETIERMTAALVHRGPDDAGIWLEGPVALGHRRLAIRDLSAGGRQPMSDQDGQVVVCFNGELYNDEYLRSVLRRDHGATFHTTCDTEVIPAAYRAWGIQCFDRFEGMYAIVLWDRRQRQLVLVRDGIGIKPLFYSEHADVVRCGSEPKALFADSDQRCELAPEGVHRFLALGYSGPDTTTFHDIRQVPPGTVITFSERGRTEYRFWQPTRVPDIHSLDEAVEGFLAMWPAIVRDHLVSDVPVGILQSGGIDSTLISLAVNDGKQPSTPLFTVSFADRSFDESPLAQLLATQLNAPFHRVALSQADSWEALLRRTVRSHDGQLADEACVPLYLLARAVKRHVTVALSGDGGDELFGGYPTYKASCYARCLGGMLPPLFWAQLAKVTYGLNPKDQSRLPFSVKVRRLAAGISDGGAFRAHAYWRRLVPRFMLRDVYSPDLAAVAESDPFIPYADIISATPGSLVDRCLVGDQRFHLPGGLLLKSDFMTMANALEVRVPFLDRRVIAFAARLNHRFLSRPGTSSKKVLRVAAHRLNAPRPLVTSRKQGFNTPIAALLRGSLAPLCERCFIKQADRLSPWLRPDAIRRLWIDHRDRVVNHDYTLWPILHLFLTLEEVVSRPAQSRSSDVISQVNLRT